MTYDELHAAAGRVAERLLAAGLAGRGRIIGLWMQRGADLFAVQLGIARAGAAWLPLDPALPQVRVAACLADAGAVAVVAGPELAGRPLAGILPVLDPRDLLAGTGGWTGDPEEAIDPSDPAYVIYTSGSTGRPKGIVIAHAAICHFLRSENELLGVRPDDRVYQGLSLSFDMSFEEVWITWLAGATLWVAPREVATDPDAIAVALERQRISVLHTVPSMAALIPGDSPGVRLLNLSGEACTPAVAERWLRPGRRVFNVYGPTEATVSATAAELAPGAPLTIGTPLPNYGVLVVDEELRPLPAGSEGELAIFGPGLAIGYLNRPELTRERFVEIDLPGAGPTRIYRSGDLARIDGDGQVRFLGRIDDQVKVRGFRIELGEIEAALADCPGVHATAVVVRDGELAAFVVGAEAGGAEALRGQLGSHLPAYMVPPRIVMVEALPRQPSGKVDRRALAALALPAAPAGGRDEPATPAEAALFEAIQAILPGRPLRRGDDFFADLGGHSLAAARLVSRLRTTGYPRATVGLVYGCSRLSGLAEALAATAAPASAMTLALPPVPLPPARRWLCAAVQAILLVVPVMLQISVWLAPFIAFHLLAGRGAPLAVATGAALAMFLLSLAAPFVAAVAAKRLVLGRLRSGRIPLWGQLYLRWWLADTLQRQAPIHLIQGTPLMNAYLRLLGARIGRGAHLGKLEVRAPDLLEIGAGATLGTDVVFANARCDGAHLIVGPVRIGRGAVVSSRCVLEDGTGVGDGASLDTMSALAHGVAVPAGEEWAGSPARRRGVAPVPVPAPPAGAWRQIWEWAMYPGAAMVVSGLFFLTVFPAFMLIDALDQRWLAGFGGGWHLAAAAGAYSTAGLLAAGVLVLLTLVLAAALHRAVCSGIRPGTWSLHSTMYYRKWFSDLVQESSLGLLHGLYATVFTATWFRLIGVRIGRWAEVSTVSGIVPPLLELGPDSYVADDVLLGDEPVRDGRMTLSGTRIGARTFLGNSSCVSDGAHLPDDVLIGVQTLAPANPALAPGQTWLGSPAVLLPRREEHTGFPAHLTFRPTAVRVLGRGAIDVVRITLPLAFVMGVGYVVVQVVSDLIVDGSWWLAAAALAVLGLVYACASVALVLAAKWALLGRYRPRLAPMWTPFVWTSEAVTAIYESLAVPNLLMFLRGTPLLAPILRLFGVRIGRGVYLDTTGLTEFDCVEIGAGAVLNGDCGPQTHLFEDRVMNIGRVRIGAGAVVGARSIVLYDSEVGEGAALGPLTLVSKGERIPARTAWTGAPAISA